MHSIHRCILKSGSGRGIGIEIAIVLGKFKPVQTRAFG